MAHGTTRSPQESADSSDLHQLVFHCTALGPHRDRDDRTVRSFLDAGLWWPRMHTVAQAIIRHCLACCQNKGNALVNGHQRSREYDRPLYRSMDFVGPMKPATRDGVVYLFACCCAWSCRYWALPAERGASGTADRLLFARVTCDLAGYPGSLGSDRAPAFTQE